MTKLLPLCVFAVFLTACAGLASCMQKPEEQSASKSVTRGLPQAISDAFRAGSIRHSVSHPSNWSGESYVIGLDGITWDTTSYEIVSPLTDVLKTIPSLANLSQSDVTKLKLEEWVSDSGAVWKKGERIGFVSPISSWELVLRDSKDPSKFIMWAKSFRSITLEKNLVLDCRAHTCVRSQDPNKYYPIDWVSVSYMFSGVDSAQAEALSAMWSDQLGIYQTATVIEVIGGASGLGVLVDATSIDDVSVVLSNSD